MDSCDAAAILAMAARGSPCVPVQTTTIESRGNKSTSPSGTKSGKSARYPTSRAAEIARFKARPTMATERPLATAARQIESIRAILLAKHVTATRPVAFAMASVSPCFTSFSDPVRPSTIALVESPTRARTPSSPTAPSRPRSVSLPSTGVSSNFQSPV